MCSINDAEFETEDEFMQRDEVDQINGSVCKKCNDDAAVVVLRVKDTYCRACFLAAATHKFRATVGKSKLVRPTDSILVGHSGKAGSTALLHLIRAGMSEAVHKRLMYQTSVLYIDEATLTKQSLEQRRSTISAVHDQVQSFGFAGYVASLNQSLLDTEPHIRPLDTADDSVEDNAALIKLFDAVSSETSKKELLRKLRQKLLVAVARRLGCSKIFTAEGATDLAVQILSNIALGRAAQLPLDVGFLDSRHQNIKILRPMREFTRKELSYYLNFHKLETVQTADLTTKKNSNASIQKLTDKFVTGLESEFSGTVSAIFRTGEKLSIRNLEANDSCESCALCNSSLDTACSSTSSLQATEFSKLVSLKGPTGIIDGDSFDLKTFPRSVDDSRTKTDNESGSCGDCTCDKGKKNAEMYVNNIQPYLCYGCRLIFKDMKDQYKLPEFLKNAARQKSCLNEMREEIADFLL